QTLSQIASAVARGNQVSRDRAMIALLRANPEAFIRGNVNLLKQGAVLRLPPLRGVLAHERRRFGSVDRSKRVAARHAQ
ncbi:FimV/HubP family polar landmark protein, partial [Klebsiella pneumoniae]|uniref:FimV/HubP family polar landmark protein n=1 Tax=Klebsiella pneumoniae TaxID=573 RepID=UPI003FD2F291